MSKTNKEKRVMDMTLSELVDKSLKEGKIPLFTFEPIEENKSNDSFQWTDELAEEFAKQYRFSSSRISVKMFKEGRGFPVTPQAENKPDWEIVAYLDNYDSKYIYRKREDGLYSTDQNRLNTLPEHYFSKSHHKIHSVKRLSDGIVFSVGDEVDIKIGAFNESGWRRFTGTITKFLIFHDAMFIECGTCSGSLEEAIPLKEYKSKPTKLHDHIGIDRNGEDTKKQYTIEDVHECCERAFNAARETVTGGYGNSERTYNKYDKYLDYKNRKQ